MSAEKHSSAEQQLQLQLEHLKRTVKSPYELIEHVIQLYGAEFEKANACIAAQDAALKASGELLQAEKRTTDELFRIKQKVVIANRELLRRNKELTDLAALSATDIVERVAIDLRVNWQHLNEQGVRSIVRRALVTQLDLLPKITDTLREAHARVLNEIGVTGSGDSGFARDLAALCDFIELYDKAQHEHESERDSADGDARTSETA